MSYPDITPLPTAPSRDQSPDAFTTTADAFVAALPDLVTEVNAAGAYIDTKTISVGNDFQGAYSAGTTYTTGQSVLYSDVFYLSLVDSNTGNTPDSSPSEWVEIVGSAAGGGGGGTIEATASGAISNGAPVSLNSDGTVSVSEGFGLTPVVFEADSTEKNTIVYDTANNKVVILYRDTSDNYGKAVVGTVSGVSISFGTPVTFAATNAEDVHGTYDSTNGKIVAIYRDASNSNYGTAVVGTVSGTSISFGSATVFESAEAATPFVAFDSNAGKVVVSYRDAGNSNYGTAVVGTVSGTSISFGTPVVFLSALTQTPFPVFDSNSNKIVILYEKSDGGKAVVGTVSGTSISFGAEAQFDGQLVGNTRGVFDSTNNKVVAVYRSSTQASRVASAVGTVSGTSISFGTRTLVSALSSANPSGAYDPDSMTVGIVWKDATSGVALYSSCTVSGTSISAGEEVSIADFVTIHNDIEYDPDNQVFIHAARNNDDSDGFAQVYNVAANITDWIGFSTSAISDAATGTITIVSGTNESQTGLTVGSKYYLTNGAELSNTENAGKEVGRALSATKLLVTQGSVS